MDGEAEGVAAVAVAVAAKLGYPSLREKQEILLKFMEERDVFGVLPMGYGKNLCFCISSSLMSSLDEQRLFQTLKTYCLPY
jgi:superfamily II DNA helicase RecQ